MSKNIYQKQDIYFSTSYILVSSNILKQILRACEHSRESQIENVKSESDQKKLTFNITYQEQKKVSQDILVIVFCNGKSLKDHLVRLKLSNVEITGRSESCGKANCHIFDFACNTVTFLPKPVVKHLKFKVRHVPITVIRLFTS